MKRYGQNSALQNHKPNPTQLVTIATSSAVPANASVYFHVPTPDSRLRVRISVLFIPPAGAANEFDATGFATLWLYEADEDTSGVSGRFIPTTNIEGTEAAPTAVPEASPLLGYSREFVSISDAIEGKFTIASNVTLGTWILQTRYQPDSVRFTNEEWDELVRQCQPTLKTAPISF
jgi:hypothetical protein